MKDMRYLELWRRFVPIFFLGCALSTFFSSCTRGYPRHIQLPSDPVVQTDLGWALVKTAYAKLKSSPSNTSFDVGYISGGSIFMLKERKIDPQGQDVGGFWYLYTHEDTKAWIHEKDLGIFPSEGQAQSAAQSPSHPLGLVQ